MSKRANFVLTLKHSIHDWIGLVSVEELYENVELSRRIQDLLKAVSKLNG
jgi:hypothetical protein